MTQLQVVLEILLSTSLNANALQHSYYLIITLLLFSNCCFFVFKSSISISDAAISQARDEK